MDLHLSRLVGHKIIVVGPGFFEQDKLESVKLVAVDPSGIWIESEEALGRIVDRFRVKPSAPGLAFFIPFTRIDTILASLEPAAPA